MNEVYNRRREVQEAIFAGERARASLQEADRQFASAGNWGLIDIFGGNTVSGLMKHMKINNASRCVEEARRDLDAFRSELGDLRDVQSRISKGRRQVQEAIRRVDDILRQLRAVQF